jgi:predicted transcriptional regulator
MNRNATSLKLPADLKGRIDRLARRGDETPHALMVRALQAQVEAMERHEAFLADAVRADKAMEASGAGYESDEVHAYLRARAAGRKARRPKPVAWRG